MIIKKKITFALEFRCKDKQKKWRERNKNEKSSSSHACFLQ